MAMAIRSGCAFRRTGACCGSRSLLTPRHVAVGSASRRQPPASTAAGLYQSGQRLLRELDARRQVFRLPGHAGRDSSAVGHARRRRLLAQGEPCAGAADAGGNGRVLSAAGQGRQNLFCRYHPSRRADTLRPEDPLALAVSGGNLRLGSDFLEGRETPRLRVLSGRCTVVRQQRRQRPPSAHVPALCMADGCRVSRRTDRRLRLRPICRASRSRFTSSLSAEATPRRLPRETKNSNDPTWSPSGDALLYGPWRWTTRRRGEPRCTS